jgi:hypothetical protein
VRQRVVQHVRIHVEVLRISNKILKLLPVVLGFLLIAIVLVAVLPLQPRQRLFAPPDPESSEFLVAVRRRRASGS